MEAFNPMHLGGRRVMVTGASSGIGRATCQYLDRLGARVILVGRDRPRLEQVVSTMDRGPHRIETFDLTALDEIPRWMKGLASEMGPMHAVVHSAGIFRLVPLRVLEADEVERTYRLNVGAAVALARGFRQKGVPASGGSIVYISSVAGLTGQPGVAAYAASKGAIISLARTLAVELARDGLRVNCVAPGMVRAGMSEEILDRLSPAEVKRIEEMHPLGFGDPVDVAGAIAFLIAETGRWITGTTLVVDGGYTAQ